MLLTPHRRLGLSMALALGGCQSFETGVQTLCDAPVNCGPACSKASAADQTALFAAHAGRSVRNDEARALLEKVETGPPAQAAESLRRAAERAQLSRCQLADHLESRGSKPAADPDVP